ncbi:MAG: hypothetical protein DRO73_07125 [Candidatus Thorarchaeota archaeon]|nr:MAG: hypothetical protein DRO73_07125 [Candidatus Thorarchaeota archaeon]
MGTENYIHTAKPFDTVLSQLFYISINLFHKVFLRDTTSFFLESRGCNLATSGGLRQACCQIRVDKSTFPESLPCLWEEGHQDIEIDIVPGPKKVSQRYVGSPLYVHSR